MATIFYRVGSGAEQSIAATYGQSVEIPGSAGQDVTFRVETDEQTAVYVPNTTHVFILGGQSNMVGRADFDGGQDYPGTVLQYDQGNNLVPAVSPLDHLDEYSGDMGLSLQFCLDYLDANPGVQVVLVPCADGGTSFQANEWGVGNHLSDALIARANQLFTDNPEFELRGILWHQGESDAGNNTYAAELDAQFSAFRSEITGAEADTPIIVGGHLPSWVGANADRLAVGAVISDTPNRVAAVAYVDPVGLSGMDTVHFNSASLRVLGSRYFEAFVGLTGGATVPAAPVDLIATPIDEAVSLSWTAPPSAGAAIIDYRIERSVDGLVYDVVVEGVSNATRYTDTGRTNGVSYSYRVAAINSEGTGAYSNVAAATPQAISSDTEIGATAHWLFGSDNPTNSDLVLGRIATGPAHAQSVGYITSPSGVMQGLDTGIAEAETQTQIYVVRRAAGDSIIGGTLTTSADDSGAGLSLFINGDAIRFNQRSGGLVDISTDAAAVSPTDFVIVALSADATTGAYVSFVGRSAGNEVVQGTLGGAFSVALRNIGIGNLHHNNVAFSDTLDIAECIIFPIALSAAEISAIAERSRARLQARGLTIL